MTGILAVWVPAVLTLFGIGAFLGISIGGRVADRRPTQAILAGAIGIAVLSGLLTLLSGQALAVIPLILLLGIAGFLLNPAIYGRVFTIAAHAPTLAGSTTVSAFQLGISLVPVFAGGVLASGAGVGAIPLIGVGLAVLTIPAALIDRGITRRDSRKAAESATDAAHADDTAVDVGAVFTADAERRLHDLVAGERRHGLSPDPAEERGPHRQ